MVRSKQRYRKGESRKELPRSSVESRGEEGASAKAEKVKEQELHTLTIAVAVTPRGVAGSNKWPLEWLSDSPGAGRHTLRHRRDRTQATAQATAPATGDRSESGPRLGRSIGATPDFLPHDCPTYAIR